MGIEKERRRTAQVGILGKSRWAGITDIVSGDTSVVVSATAIESGAVIMTGLGITSTATHQNLITSVNSLVTNTSMVLQTQQATVAGQPVWYAVIETED